MPAKLDRCVDDVKGEHGTDSAYAICNSSIKEEVATAIGIAGVDEINPEVHQEVSTALGIAGVGRIQEDHSPLDRGDYEAPDDPISESVSIPNSLSNVGIGADTKKIEEIGDNVIKQLLETQIGECPCKTKLRPKA